MLADADGADEDGLAFVPIFTPSSGTYLAQVSVYNNTGGNATLIAWLDFNGNGTFDAGETCQAIPPIPSSPLPQNRFLFWPSAPSTLPNGSFTYLRIRITRATNGMTNANATGYYEDGETEDYRILVDDFPLKVNLLSFGAQVTADDKVKLDWVTSGEENFNGFEVQRSADNINWTVLTTVFATGNGNQSENDYTYIDLQPLPGKSFYRLRLVSGNGKFSYSETRTVNIKKGIQQIIVSPNPANDVATLSVYSLLDTECEINIMDMNGRFVYKQTVAIHKGTNNIDLPIVKKMSSGLYLVQVRIQDDVFVEKLIINKK